MLRPITRTFLVIFACFGYAHGQTSAELPAFDAASVKPVVPGAPLTGRMGENGGPGTGDPGRIAYRHLPLQYLISLAYDVPSQLIIGPSWLSTERYDVEATLPSGTTKAQLKLMLRRLLADRFALALHRESREVSALVLVVAKSGLKLTASTPDSGNAPELVPAQPAGRGPYGFPTIQPGMGAGGLARIIKINGNNRLTVRNETMDAFVILLTGELRQPVVNSTGLAGEYDVVLYYLDETPAPPDVLARRSANPNPPDNAPPLRAAIEHQLGLTLQPKKAPVDFLTVDHAARIPTEN